MPDRSLRTTAHRIQTLAVMALCLVLTTACGFSLRGNERMVMPITSLQLQTLPGSELGMALSERLRRANVRVLEPGAEVDSSYLLQLIDEQFDRRAVTSAGRARGAQYLVTLEVTALLYFHGDVVAGPETLSVQRRHDEDATNIAGSSRELAVIRTEMSGELAERILNRLQTVDPP